MVIAAAPDLTPPDARGASSLARKLVGKWPWLGNAGQDLTEYVTDITALFAAFSIDAAKYVLHPLTGPDWKDDRPPAGTALRRELAAYDNRQRAAVKMARWIIEEDARRREMAEADARIEAERQAFREKCGGRDPVEILMQGRTH